jgi:hypothetical protein
MRRALTWIHTRVFNGSRSWPRRFDDKKWLYSILRYFIQCCGAENISFGSGSTVPQIQTAVLAPALAPPRLRVAFKESFKNTLLAYY